MSANEPTTEPDIKLPIHTTETTPLLPTETPSPQKPPPQRRNDASGYFYMLLSSLFFSGMSLFVHVAEQSHSISAPTTVFFRGIVNLIASSIYIGLYLTPRTILSNLSSTEKCALAIRGILGSLGMVALFTALRHLPMGEAVTIFFTNPIFTLILSHFIIHEPLTPSDILSGLISLLGVFLISYQPNEQALPDAIRPLGIACAISAAIVTAVAFTMVRVLGSKIHFMVSIFALSSCSLAWAFVLGGVPSFADLMHPSTGLIMAFVAGLFASAGQCCLDKGLQHCRAGPGLLVRNIDVPLCYVLGLMTLGEQPSWKSFWGSVLVVLAAGIVGARQIMKM